MATFTTNDQVNFPPDIALPDDLAPLLLLINKGAYYAADIGTSFSVNNGNPLGTTVHATGAFAGDPLGGTINSLSLDFFSGATYTITDLSIDLDALIADLNVGLDNGLAALFAGDDVMTGSTKSDFLRGYRGGDILHGGDGSDNLY